MWDNHRRQVRQLESEVELKLIAYSKAVSSQIYSISTEKDLEHLLVRVNSLVFDY